MDIAPNVYSVEVGQRFNNIYLIKGRYAAFFDSGFDTDESVDAERNMWECAGSPEVAAIVVSHRHADHSGGARRLNEEIGGVIMRAPTEKEPIEREVPGTQIGRTVTEGETMDLGGAMIQFIYTPGHTVGSLSAVYLEEGVLFAGDTIRTSDPFKIDPNAGNLDMQFDTLRKLQAFDLRVIGPGHGPVVDDPVKYIGEEIVKLEAD